MPHATLINTTDLNLWASRREAQSKLPQLLRRLIHATTPNIHKMSFPADESVQLGGWDGIVEVEVGNEFVPDGLSVWELGVNRDVKAKADDDYEKRTTAPGEIDPLKTTFIFVTPRRWGGKEGWVQQKRNEGKWLDVRAYDADDLEAFLETAPAVHIWASILLGKRPEGAIDIGHFWLEWSSITKPQTTPSLVISGRQEAVNDVFQWLQDQPSCLSLQAETQDESVAFLAACIQLLPDEVKAAVLMRSVVVEHEVEWRRLSLYSEPLILIPTFGDRSLVASATQRGHHVLLPLGLSEAPTTANIALNRPHREAVHQALKEMKLPEHQLGDLATLGRRSLSALRRRLAHSKSVLVPGWANPSEARALLPALFVGHWNDSNGADREIIARLAGHDYSQVNDVLLRWANSSYPFVRRVGDVWLVVSKEDSWLLLSRFITGDDLRRFEEVTLEVLGQANPKYELEIDKRPMAALFAKQLQNSNHLRTGIAETLALMAARSNLATFADASTGQDWADRIVYKLFASVTTWEHWATLGTLLIPLAEASPNHFLDAVETLLIGEQPIAATLFDQEASLWGGPEHTGLLWALEVLAWSPEYLARVAKQLARLSDLDPATINPKGKWANRPNKSLREIFLSWYPCTMATAEQRLKVIDQLRKHEPSVAWKLMVDILPYPRSITRLTHKPDWRDWAVEAGPPVTRQKANPMIRELVDRLVNDVGTDDMRWKSLIPLVDNLPDEQCNILIDKIKEVSASLNNQQLRASLREIMRTTLSRHIAHSTARWRMPQERIEQLLQIYTQLEPQDLVARHAWQFSHSAQFLIEETEDWSERQEKQGKSRKQVIQEIYKTGGLPDIMRLAEQAEHPYSVGWTLGSILSLGTQEDEFILQALAATESYLVSLSQGYIHGRLAFDVDWCQSKLNSPLFMQATPLQKANFYLCLASEKHTWDLVEIAGQEVEQLYWSRVGLWGIREWSGEDLQYFVVSLAAHNRLTEAIHYVSAQSHTKEGQLPPLFIANMIELALDNSNPQQVDWQQLVNDIPHLLSIIEGSGKIEELRLVRLEWEFLPWFEYSEYQPKTLMKSLADDPAFFCELLKWVFKAEDEEPRQLSRGEESRARNAYVLLDLWQKLPGSDEQGNIDPQKLLEWMRTASALAHDSGRGAVGDQQIGQLLSHSPPGHDELWPHEAVRTAIEEIANNDVELGFDVGSFNNRGGTSRGLTEGGIQEREIANRYRHYALMFRDEWPRISRMLNRMADKYERYARGEDLDADLTQDLWR